MVLSCLGRFIALLLVLSSSYVNLPQKGYNRKVSYHQVLYHTLCNFPNEIVLVNAISIFHIIAPSYLFGSYFAIGLLWSRWLVIVLHKSSSFKAAILLSQDVIFHAILLCTKRANRSHYLLNSEHYLILLVKLMSGVLSSWYFRDIILFAHTICWIK